MSAGQREWAVQQEPQPPETRQPRRARYGVTLDDGQDYVGRGWVLLDGPWLHVIDDEHGVWQTLPAHAVTFVEWAAKPQEVVPW